MKRLHFLTTLLWLAAVSLGAADLELLQNGVIRLAGKSYLQFYHYSPQWFPNRQGDGNLKLPATQEAQNARFSGKWALRGSDAVLDFNTEVEQLTPDCWNVLTQVSSPAGVPTGCAALQLEVPIHDLAGELLRAGDRTLRLPPRYQQELIGVFSKATQLQIPYPDGVAELRFPQPVEIQLRDPRKFNVEQYAIRILPATASAVLTTWEIRFQICFTPYRTRPVSLATAANQGFADEIEGDRQGGWTDQGPDNDLRMMKPGTIRHGTIELEILDPAANQGKSAIVLGGGGRRYFPSTRTLSTDKDDARTLFLLHAVAWPPKGEVPIGEITATTRSGKTVTREVRFLRDVENWWMPGNLPNGAVGWSAFGKNSPVGLYLSKFELPGEPLQILTFTSNGKSVWMIVAASLSAQDIPLPIAKSYTLWRNELWRPLETDRSVEAGSALDFSFLLDAPAGKHGFIQADRKGNFEFEEQPGKPVRFYGVNLCLTANYMEHHSADLLAERLARIGYNALRIHHFDRDLVEKDQPDSVTFDEIQRDKLEYLLAQTKARGLYLTLDLFTCRNVSPAELGLTLPIDANNYKLLAMIQPAAKQNLLSFARNLLCHVNPYTGLALKDDPALIGISLINENTLPHVINKANPEVRRLYDQAFDDYCRRQKQEVTAQNRNTLYRAFLHDFYRESHAELRKELRSWGVKAPLTDQNYISAPAQTIERNTYDYVDNHMYFDHPIFIGRDWSLPIKLNNCSVMAMRLQVPKNLANSRVFGKPFTVTEFDFCHPNEFRAEGAPVFAAYAAMQNWGAIYRFAYAHHWRYMLTEATDLNSFDVANDPVRLLGERLGMAFFVRGDVQPSATVFPVAVPDDPNAVKHYFSYPEAANDLLFFGQTGSVLYHGGKPVGAMPEQVKAIYSLLPDTPAEMLPDATGKETVAALLQRGFITPEQADPAADRYQNDTGELRVDFQQETFLVDTPASSAMVLPKGRELSSRLFRGKTLDTFAVLGVIRLTPERYLLLHLTDVKAEKITFASDDRKVITDDGNGQLLAHRGRAEFSLPLPERKWKLYALDCSGRRQQEVPFQFTDGTLRFTADTFLAPKITFAYELVAQTMEK